MPHEVVNLSAGQGVRGGYHIQTANSRPSRFQGFLRPSRGAASKDLSSYLRWFRQVELSGEPFARVCLSAALSTPCKRFAN